MCLSRYALLSRIFFILLTIFACRIFATPAEDKCKECRFLVATFKQGLNRTSKSHFGGGNTDWEERKLGKFVTSEIRFEEVMEFVCKKESLVDASDFNSKDLQFKCHALAEEAEEVLEQWFFELQDERPDLDVYLCVERQKRCCPIGHYGAACDVCPGLVSTTAVSQHAKSDDTSKAATKRGCFGRGRCNGDGTRGGTGKCECDVGYVGKMCSNCGPHFFADIKTDTFLQCEECFDGCSGGCSAAGPKGCKACRSGYAMDEVEGCKDIDECAAAPPNDDGAPVEPKCTKAHENCVNTQGSYHCACEDGYRLDEDGEECELDVQARPMEGIFPPDVLLRAFAIFALIGTCVFVWLFHRTTTTVALTLLAIGAAVFVEYHYDWIVPKAARKFIDHSFPRGL